MDRWHFSDDEAAQLAGAVDTTHPDMAPFWAGTREGRLVAQWCPACERHRWPPRPVCRACGTEPQWREIESAGRLYSWTVVHLSPLPAFAAHVPYVVAVVELPAADGIRMVGRLEGSDDELVIGDALRVAFQRVDDDVVLPVWILPEP
jgi:uncharacterized OB-fold protein